LNLPHPVVPKKDELCTDDNICMNGKELAETGSGEKLNS
jgi:hypothetical protein